MPKPVESSFERPGPPSPNTRTATRLSGMEKVSDAPRRKTTSSMYGPTTLAAGRLRAAALSRTVARNVTVLMVFQRSCTNHSHNEPVGLCACGAMPHVPASGVPRAVI